jgi:hypothetical protein
MKNIIFLFVFLFTINTGRTQSNIQINAMINNCLFECLSKIYTSALIIDYYPFAFEFSDSIKNKIINKELNYVSIRNPNNRKLFKKGQFVWLFSGVLLDKNKIVIQFTYESIQYKKKMVYIGISCWYKFFYEYSNDEKRWILVDKEFGGI